MGLRSLRSLHLQSRILSSSSKFCEILSGAFSTPIARTLDSVPRSQAAATAGKFESKAVAPESFARVWGLGTPPVRTFSSSSVQQQQQQVDAKCWSCEKNTSDFPFFVCSSCRAIQPLDLDVDFFQLLSVDRSYVQDPKILEKKYKQLQKFLHPDLSSGKSEREQGYAADQSAQVIKAYYTLLNPLSRAQYMLKLNGVNVDEEGTIHDPALLMEIMELREEVEEATDVAKLVKIKEENKKKMLECENSLKGVFESADITKAVPLVQRMTYYHKIIEEITRKQ